MPKFPLSGYHPHATRKKPSKGTPPGAFFTGKMIMFQRDIEDFITHSRHAATPFQPQWRQKITPEGAEEYLSANRTKGQISPELNRIDALMDATTALEHTLNVKFYRQFGNKRMQKNQFNLRYNHSLLMEEHKWGKWKMSWLPFWNQAPIGYNTIEILEEYVRNIKAEYDFLTSEGKITIPLIAPGTGPALIYLTDIEWFPDAGKSPMLFSAPLSCWPSGSDYLFRGFPSRNFFGEEIEVYRALAPISTPSSASTGSTVFRPPYMIFLDRQFGKGTAAYGKIEDHFSEGNLDSWLAQTPSTWESAAIEP